MDNTNSEYNEIIKNNFNEPSEDYYMVQFIRWMHGDECLLSERELDYFTDEENMIEHLSTTYDISPEEAKKAFYYAEDMYLSSDQHGSLNE